MDPTVTVTNDQQVRITVRALDAEGIPAYDPAVTVSIDHPELASLTADSDPTGDYIVRRVGGQGAATVVVTASKLSSPGNPSITTSVTIVFNPGATVAISATATVEPLTPAS